MNEYINDLPHLKGMQLANSIVQDYVALESMVHELHEDVKQNAPISQESMSYIQVAVEAIYYKLGESSPFMEIRFDHTAKEAEVAVEGILDTLRSKMSKITQYVKDVWTTTLNKHLPRSLDIEDIRERVVKLKDRMKDAESFNGKIPVRISGTRSKMIAVNNKIMRDVPKAIEDQLAFWDNLVKKWAGPTESMFNEVLTIVHKDLRNPDLMFKNIEKAINKYKGTEALLKSALGTGTNYLLNNLNITVKSAKNKPSKLEDHVQSLNINDSLDAKFPAASAAGAMIPSLSYSEIDSALNKLPKKLDDLQDSFQKFSKTCHGLSIEANRLGNVILNDDSMQKSLTSKQINALFNLLYLASTFSLVGALFIVVHVNGLEAVEAGVALAEESFKAGTKQ